MNYKVADSDLTSVANAIRTKGGTSASLSFPDGFVTAIGNISTGGSTLITKSITANGTYNASSDSADGYSSVTVSVTAPYATGTFTGDTAGTALTVSIPYTGSGYPIAVIIYPSYGTYKSGTDFYSLVKAYAFSVFALAKNSAGDAPAYNAEDSDTYSIVAMYKSSISDPTQFGRAYVNVGYVTRPTAATKTVEGAVRISSPTTMSVYIHDDAGTSYGFAKDIEYRYHIMYSA